MNLDQLAEHPWQSAKDRFDNHTLPLLRAHGGAIGEASIAGSELAKQIISTYEMLYRSFDPMTAHLLDEKLKEYLK